jgi:glycine betaine transporter
MSSNGDLNPSTKKKLIWGVIQSTLALVLMLAGSNGLQMLQTASIVAAFPFAFIMIAGMVSLVKALKTEDLEAIAEGNRKREQETQNIKSDKVV